MHEVKRLELLWEQYDKKRKRPIVGKILFYLLLLLLIVGAGYYLYPLLKKTGAVSKVDTVTPVLLVEESFKTPLKSKKEISVKPITKLEKPKKDFEFEIQKSTTEENIELVKSRFEQSQDPADSLYVARYYFKKGNYIASQDWALKSNRINSDIAEGWILFAKSKVMLGHKKEAIKILRYFLSKRKSVEVSRALDWVRAQR